MSTSNEEFLSAMIRHQIYLLRLSGGVRNEMLKVLNASESGMADKIRSVLRSSSSLITPSDYAKMQKLLDAIAEIRGSAWDGANSSMTQEMLALAQAEPGFVSALMATTAPVLITANMPAGNLLKAIVTSRPFEGRTLKEWASRMKADDIARISNAIRAGMLASDTTEDIVRRVIGTSSFAGADGTTQMTRNQVHTITRTAVQHVANQARAMFLQDNIDVILMEQFIATLDSRTTPVCRANDKKRFLPGKGPMPPLHMACRSLRVAAMNAESLVNRPANPTTEKMLLREYTERNKLLAVRSRDDLPRGTKGAFDLYSRKRIREMVGPVPGAESYQTWLSKQSAAFQDDILGKAKGKLFRDGGLSLDKFVDRNGSEYTLAELAKAHKKAFTDAGLEPKGF